MDESSIYTRIAQKYIHLIAIYSPTAAEVLEEIRVAYGPHAACAGANAVNQLRHCRDRTDETHWKRLCARLMEDYPEGLPLLERVIDCCFSDDPPSLLSH